jgi:hypothetical protein
VYRVSFKIYIPNAVDSRGISIAQILVFTKDLIILCLLSDAFPLQLFCGMTPYICCFEKVSGRKTIAFYMMYVQYILLFALETQKLDHGSDTAKTIASAEELLF